MVEPGGEERIGDSCGAQDSFSARKAVAIVIKGIVVLFPLAAAFVTGAPPEFKVAGVYCSLVALGLFVALGEIAAGVRRVGEILEQQHRSS